MTTASTSRTQVGEITLEPRSVLGRRERVAVSDLPAFFARALPAVAADLQRAGIAPQGPPIAAYRHESGGTFEVTVGFPVRELPDTAALVHLRLPGGRAVQAMHTGPYRTLHETYARLSAWFASRHLQPPALMWEEYLVGPDAEGETGCLTRVVYPLT